MAARYEAENGCIWYGCGDVWVWVHFPGVERMTQEQAERIAELLNMLAGVVK